MPAEFLTKFAGACSRSNANGVLSQSPRLARQRLPLGARLEPETTPTALRPTAQRCGNAATLGYESNESNNLNEVVAVCARVGIATTALRLEMFVER